MYVVLIFAFFSSFFFPLPIICKFSLEEWRAKSGNSWGSFMGVVEERGA